MSVSKQRRVEIFCQAIQEGKSQSDAYRLAYPSSLKWKSKTVHEKASLFAKDAKVTARLQELNERQLKRHDLAIDAIAQKMGDTAYFDMANLLDDKGELKPFHELDEHTRSALSVKIENGELVCSFSNRERLTALEKLGIYTKHGGFSQHHILTGMDDGPIETSNIDIVELARLTAFMFEKARLTREGKLTQVIEHEAQP